MSGLPFASEPVTAVPQPVGPPGGAGAFLPANATPVVGMDVYDPWRYAQLAQQADHSQPEHDEYGEATMFSPASIVAEWGGMPAPVRDWQDQDHSVLLVPYIPLNSSGPAGQFYGPQQTAWEYGYVEPVVDYGSTVFLGVGQ